MICPIIPTRKFLLLLKDLTNQIVQLKTLFFKNIFGKIMKFVTFITIEITGKRVLRKTLFQMSFHVVFQLKSKTTGGKIFAIKFKNKVI